MTSNPKPKAIDERDAASEMLAHGQGEAVPSRQNSWDGFISTISSSSGKSHLQWFDFVRLSYSAFLFIEPAGRNSVPYWIQFAGVYVCFLILYFSLVRSKTRRTSFTLLFLMGLLGVVYFPANGGALAIFIYVVSFAAFLTDTLKACLSIFAAVCLAMAAEGVLLHLNPWIWAFGALLALAIGTGNLVIVQQRRSDAKLHLAHEQIERLAKIAERERIARDLHDVLGHTLSVIVLKSELAGKLSSRNLEQSQKEIAEVEQIARTALNEVREAIRGYRSEGLAAEVARARSTLEAAGVSFDCGTPPASMHIKDETVLSLALREAITNIVRHAGARRCRVDFQKNGSGIVLCVEDDGRGHILQEGNGLRGMRERVQSIGGTISIHSGHGTRLEIRVPLNA